MGEIKVKLAQTKKIPFDHCPMLRNKLNMELALICSCRFQDFL